MLLTLPLSTAFSPKPMACFAAGGFALTDHKADIARALGPFADEICYDSADEFAGKVEFFLINGRRRREVAREIGAIVRRKYSTEALFARYLPLALMRLKARYVGCSSEERRHYNRLMI
jgi:spore maturation protein CgeB